MANKKQYSSNMEEKIELESAELVEEELQEEVKPIIKEAPKAKIVQEQKKVEVKQEENKSVEIAQIIGLGKQSAFIMHHGKLMSVPNPSHLKVGDMISFNI